MRSLSPGGGETFKIKQNIKKKTLKIKKKKKKNKKKKKKKKPGKSLHGVKHFTTIARPQHHHPTLPAAPDAVHRIKLSEKAISTPGEAQSLISAVRPGWVMFSRISILDQACPSQPGAARSQLFMSLFSAQLRTPAFMLRAANASCCCCWFLTAESRVMSTLREPYQSWCLSGQARLY